MLFTFLIVGCIFQAHGKELVAGNIKSGAEPFSNIQVGYKTSDSTGVITINNSNIQQSLIPAISILNGFIINGTATLSVGTGAVYLLFNAKSGDTLNVRVAVELTVSGNNQLSFKEHGRKTVHIVSNKGACAQSDFIMDRQKRITGCVCTQVNHAPALQDWSCQHRVSVQL